MDTQFAIKVIRWTKDYSGDEPFVTPILLQDANGPCPLIALVNSLLIKNDVACHRSRGDRQQPDADDEERMARINQFKQQLMKHGTEPGSVSLGEVLHQLGDLVLFFSEGAGSAAVDGLLSQLPVMHTGLDVNPNLINGTFVGDNIASELFDLFGLKFRHGWCVNQVSPETDAWPADVDYAAVVDDLYRLQSFDNVQDYLLHDDPANASHQQGLRRWLDLNCTQLTNNGLSRLNTDLADDDVVVFFRNNHFNTMYKKSDHEFYLLVTDMSVQKSNKIIWQSLNSVSGADDLFFTGEFYPVLEMDEADGDDDLAKQLQQEEDAALAREVQANYDAASKRPGSKRSRMTTRRKDRQAHEQTPMVLDASDTGDSIIPKPKPVTGPAKQTESAPAPVETKEKNGCMGCVIQ
ncbi:ubiquitin carboxyl-terminal hydrolase MIY1 [Diutina catenulata]